MKRRIVRVGEKLAMLPDALRSGDVDGRRAIWWDQSAPIPPNERDGAVEVVHVRGSLEHHPAHGCDSYEGILARARCAFAGIDANGEECGQPDAVVLRIDSPGGVVSGLNETVFALRRLSAESGIPLIAYVDELAASAAYALACSCDEIVLPASAICGSIGVISTMFDQVEADKQMGINFVTLTSGARKADGHPHEPITDAAINAEQRRVDRLAKQFFKIVQGARGMSIDAIAGLEAGIFLGREAVARGLADAVMGWDEVCALLNESGTVKKKVDETASATTQVQKPTGRSVEEKRMSTLAIRALVKKTSDRLAAEKDAKKRAALEASLASYRATLEAMKKEKHTIEKYESEESSEEEDEADEAAEEAEEAAEESEESEEAESKGNETDRKQNGDGDDDDGDDDGDGDEDEAESKRARKALLGLAEQTTGKKGSAAVGAVAAMLAEGKRAAKIVDQISKERRAEKKQGLIVEAVNARAITRGEAKALAGKPMSFVASFIDMRRTRDGKLRAIVNVDDESIRVPDPNASAGGNGTGVTLSPDVLKQIDIACSAAPGDRVALRKKMIADHEKRTAAAGRY